MSGTHAFDVLCLHPDMVSASLTGSVLGKAARAGHLHVGVHNIRDVTTDRHHMVDDTPSGGGAGMVMKVDVVAAALAQVRRPDSRVLLTSPMGRRFDQAFAAELAACPHVVVICGHYEGIDARIEGLVDDLVSLGDFVLTGGEIVACAIVDATARLLPGVLGNEASALDESFSEGLLEYPQYTRPRVWGGQEIPAILMSGDHGKVASWRRAQAMGRTRDHRPDLWIAWCAANAWDPAAPIWQYDPDAPPPGRKRRRRTGIDGPARSE